MRTHDGFTESAGDRNELAKRDGDAATQSESDLGRLYRGGGFGNTGAPPYFVNERLGRYGVLNPLRSRRQRSLPGQQHIDEVCWVPVNRSFLLACQPEMHGAEIGRRPEHAPVNDIGIRCGTIASQDAIDTMRDITAASRDAATERPRFASAEVMETREEGVEQDTLTVLQTHGEAKPEASAFRDGEVIMMEDAIGSTEPNGLIEAKLLKRSPRQPELGRTRPAQCLEQPIAV
jgi:hypothetical protein